MKKVCLFLIFLSLNLFAKDYKYDVAITAIFRDDSRFLKEWIEYHRIIGVEHFYLYNNLSLDNYKEVLKPYIKKGIVELIDWPYESYNVYEWGPIQKGAYKDAIAKCKGIAKWLAVIDTDEFIVPKTTETLPDLLKTWEKIDVGGVCITWVFFGTSHVKRINDNELMIDLLRLNGGISCNGNLSAIWNNGAYKSIIRPERILNCVSPHYCTYQAPYYHFMAPFNLVQMNHYWSRDEDFFYNVKIPRRVLWGNSLECTIAYEKGMNLETEQGEPILRFIEKLRRKMGF